MRKDSKISTLIGFNWSFGPWYNNATIIFLYIENKFETFMQKNSVAMCLNLLLDGSKKVRYSQNIVGLFKKKKIHEYNSHATTKVDFGHNLLNSSNFDEFTPTSSQIRTIQINERLPTQHFLTRLSERS